MVVWEVFDGSDWEIAFYDGSCVTILTDNTADDCRVQIADGRVVWLESDGVINDIVLNDNGCPYEFEPDRASAYVAGATGVERVRRKRLESTSV